MFVILPFLEELCNCCSMEVLWIDGVLNQTPVILTCEDEPNGFKYGTLTGFVIADDDVEIPVQLKSEILESLESLNVYASDMHGPIASSVHEKQQSF